MKLQFLQYVYRGQSTVAVRVQLNLVGMTYDRVKACMHIAGIQSTATFAVCGSHKQLLVIAVSSIYRYMIQLDARESGVI